MDGSVARRFLLGLAPWIGAVALWYGVRWSGFVNVSLIPAPHQVAAKFVELLLQEGLLFDIFASTRRVFLGVMLGILAAVPVGFLLGWYRPARTFADPMINFFRALPPIALIPLVIVYFGVDEVAKLVILFYASFFSGVIVMYEGVRRSPRSISGSRRRSAPASSRFSAKSSFRSPCRISSPRCASRWASPGRPWSHPN